MILSGMESYWEDLRKAEGMLKRYFIVKKMRDRQPRKRGLLWVIIPLILLVSVLVVGVGIYSAYDVGYGVYREDTEIREHPGVWTVVFRRTEAPISRLESFLSGHVAFAATETEAWNEANLAGDALRTKLRDNDFSEFPPETKAVAVSVNAGPNPWTDYFDKRSP